MKTAYLYVRVSTDEQKRKGFSLPEQEDRLLKYCELNDIRVKGIFREDYSAKNFNRPEWKKLTAVLKRNSAKESNNILFVKWDRFSRNIEYAYEMIGILRKYNTTAIAIDQPVDFKVPESSVMLAVYLAIPEAENGRRSLNSKNGIRRAKQLGRYPNKAPLGYKNVCAPDGKKQIALHRPDADLIKWSFQQLSKNAYRIEDVRRMANAKGLKCSRTNFWRLLHNPVYCGYVSFSSNESDERELVKGIHEPIVSPNLFNEVQAIINTKRKIVKKTYVTNELFILHRYLICPHCNNRLYGSFSQGRSKKYPYYHCRAGCKTRFKADLINESYENKLKKLKISNGVAKLFELVLKDININTQIGEHLIERTSLLKQIKDQELFISKARKLFVIGKIELDDFSKIKKEYLDISRDLSDELGKVTVKLYCINKQLELSKPLGKFLHGFKDMEVTNKKLLINFIQPSKINADGIFSLRINGALSKIFKSNYRIFSADPSEIINVFSQNQCFRDRKVSVNKAMNILAQNDIHVDEGDASVILDFLYFIAKLGITDNNKLIHDKVNGKSNPKKLNSCYC